ncbi:hypothetical protein BH10PSE15_BH10PSE15_16620 [soil metagenome]
MKKAILLCAMMGISAPAFARTTTADPQAAPMTQSAPAQSTAPATADPSASSPSQTAATAPAAPTATAQTSPAPAAGDPATQTAEQPAQQPASGGTQVAQVVDTEFATYDNNKDGVLSKTEFGAWMVALKTASDPSTKAEAATTKTWVGQAFASADKDKSKSVSKTELTGFLSQGQS